VTGLWIVGSIHSQMITFNCYCCDRTVLRLLWRPLYSISYMTGVNRASIYLAAQNIAINIFKLESEGLRILANGQARQLRSLQAYNEKRDLALDALHKRTEMEYDDESEIY
jgi:hypothetical protein